MIRPAFSSGVIQREYHMTKNPPRPNCPKCGKATRFMLVKTGGRRFRCIECDASDPIQLPEVAKLLTGELRRPK